MVEDVKDEVQDVDVGGDIDEVEDAIHDVHAHGKAFLCKVSVEEVVVEPPLGDVVADAEGKVPVESQALDVQDVNVDL